MKRYWQLASLGGKIATIWILLMLVISLFAYSVIPDKTQNANQQIPELGLLPPMSEATIFSFGKMDYSFWSGYTGVQTAFPISQLISLNDNILIYKDQQGNSREFQQEEFSSMTLTQLNDSNVKTHKYWFGTDRYGRDLLSRLILGIRVSLAAGAIAVLVATIIGLLLGMLSGYFGGWLDSMTLFTINTLWAFPTILLVFAIVLTFGRSLTVIFIAVGCTLWVDVARLVRGQVKQIREEPYIISARSYGADTFRIMRKHILPNISGPLLVITAANFAIAILIEAGLSYLGFGVSPPAPSLGNILNENYGFALGGMFFLAIIPALSIMMLVLSFNFVSKTLDKYLQSA